MDLEYEHVWFQLGYQSPSEKAMTQKPDIQRASKGKRQQETAELLAGW